MKKICLYDHHDYPIPTDGIGGVIGLFQLLYEELSKFPDFELTIIVNDKSTLVSYKNFKVIKLPFSEIENIRFGRVPITKYFNGEIFYSNSSGRHVDFDFSNFQGKWVAVCHGCEEWVGDADCQIFVSNNQLKQHLRDNLFDGFSNDYRVVHGVVDTEKLYFRSGTHDRIVWMGRVDGAKAERLYDIALRSNEIILAAGWYTNEWEWLFEKIISTGKIEWVGKISGDEEKVKFYSNAKLSIHCSTFEDPCPTTVLEAQACGIPVISYANGSMYEISYYKDLIFDHINPFIEKLNNFDVNRFHSSELRKFVIENFRKEVYGSKFYSILNKL